MIAPTGRAAAAAALGAPVALMVGVLRPEVWWLALAWLGGLLLAMAMEAALLPTARRIEVSIAAPFKVSVADGFDAVVSVKGPRRLRRAEVALVLDPRVESGANGFLSVPLDHGGGVVHVAVRARRRGTAVLGPIDVRWTGGLGVVARYRRVVSTTEVLIVPDVRKILSDAVWLLAEDSANGQNRQNLRGHGGEFEALTEFRDGIDRRHVDWKASARHATLLAKEHNAERDNAIVLAVDCGRLMCEPIDGLARVDRAIGAALLTGYAALKSGDRVGLFAFAARPRQVSLPRGGIASFGALQRAAAGIDYAFEETNFALSLSELGRRLDRRSLIILFTEFVDTISAELMLRVTGQLRRRHLVVAVVFRDFELETIAAGEPRNSDDIARAVMAAGLLQERRLVLARLRKLGVDVIEGAHAEIGPRLVRHYLEIKTRRRLLRQSVNVFRRDREADWLRLESLVARVERGSMRALSDNDLLALPVLYRGVLSALSVARETSLDRALVLYLEGLAARAYFVVYGVRRSLGLRVAGFIVRDWPAAVASLWRETLVALGLIVAGALAGYFLVAHDPAWFSALIPNSLAEGRTPAASTESLRKTLTGAGEDGLGLFAAFLFTHNAQVAILSFALGFAFGVPTTLLLLNTGAQMGALMAAFASHELGMEFGGWLAIHGTTELLAIAIAAAAGFRIGMALIFPKPTGRVAGTATAGRAGATVMIGTIIMLSVAGVLEGIGRQTVQAEGLRYEIGIGALCMWLVYFFAFRGRSNGN